jgi:hypothetical protein
MRRVAQRVDTKGYDFDLGLFLEQLPQSAPAKDQVLQNLSLSGKTVIYREPERCVLT